MENWHLGQKKQVESLINTNRMPHALLISGEKGIGKLAFAQMIAKMLLFNTEHAKELFYAGAHPDYCEIRPLENKKSIGVDQIRTLISFSSKTAHLKAAKVIVIEPADAMNINAANALLKTLEEPSAHTFLLLVTNRPYALLPTVRSRCQQILLKKPDQDLALSWLLDQDSAFTKDDAHLALLLAGGAPLIGLDYLQSDFLSARKEKLRSWFLFSHDKLSLSQIIKQWKNEPLIDLLSIILRLIEDMLYLKNGQNERVVNQDIKTHLFKLSEKLSSLSLHDYAHYLHQTIQMIYTTTSLNEQLLLEESLMRWRKILK